MSHLKPAFETLSGGGCPLAEQVAFYQQRSTKTRVRYVNLLGRLR